VAAGAGGVNRSAVALALGLLVVVAGAVAWAPLWQRAGPPAAGSIAGSGSSDRGASLFVSKGCASCHDGPDTEAFMSSFPSLRSASSWAGARRPPMSAAEYLAESIRTPGAFTSPSFVPDGSPTSAMPQLELDDAEIDAVVAYLLQG
jgi:mono/diheme cytochrome c family protein